MIFIDLSSLLISKHHMLVGTVETGVFHLEYFKHLSQEEGINEFTDFSPRKTPHTVVEPVIV